MVAVHPKADATFDSALTKALTSTRWPLALPVYLTQRFQLESKGEPVLAILFLLDLLIALSLQIRLANYRLHAALEIANLPPKVAVLGIGRIVERLGHVLPCLLNIQFGQPGTEPRAYRQFFGFLPAVVIAKL